MMKKMREMKELQKKKGKKGFSMIELIIVIAIMAILIALIGTQLIPYLEKSRRSKDLTTLDTCLTNFESALASAEVSPKKGTSATFSNIDSQFPSGNGVKVSDALAELAGSYYDTTKKDLTYTFKSKEAAGGTLTFGVDAAGQAYVTIVGTSKEHGGLYVSSGFSGMVDDKSANASGGNGN